MVFRAVAQLWIVRPHYTFMKIGTFSEALHSLFEKYRSVFQHRGFMIALWCQLALIVGMVCSYLIVRASSDIQIVWSGFAVFIVGLPALTLGLGIGGVLPGTHRKKSL